MNLLWPIIVIAIGAVVWWLLGYLKAPQPFYVALVVVLAISLIIWLTGFAGYGPVLQLR